MKVRSLIDNFIDYLMIFSIILFTLSPIILHYYENTISKREQKINNSAGAWMGDPGNGVHHLRIKGHDCFTYSRHSYSTAISCTRIPETDDKVKKDK